MINLLISPLKTKNNKNIPKPTKIWIKSIPRIKKIAGPHLEKSWREIPHVTQHDEADITEMEKFRKSLRDLYTGEKITITPLAFIIRAVVKALKEYPDVHSMIDEDHQIKFDFYDISIAVSGPKGLMVPVVRNAQDLTFAGIEKEIKRLAVKARDGQITVDDMSGGTFTISNGGVFGSMLSTPILNPPQSAILGMHNIIERPIAVRGKVEVHPMMYLALSYDHRIIDGKESVGFLLNIKESLENPIKILMNNDIENSLEI